MIKAVIFDVDGLLIDTEPFWRRAHIRVLEKRGYHITAEDVRSKSGKLTAEIIEDWRKQFGWESSQNDIIQHEIEQTVIEAVRSSGRAMPGVERVVSLFKQHNLPMSAASASAPAVLETSLKRINVYDELKIVHSAVHEKRGKPFPDVFLATAKQMNVEPAACLVFEDSLNGVKAAKAANMHCIAVPHESYDKEAFKIADLILPSLDALSWEMIEKL